MFIRYFVEIPRSVGQAEAAILAMPDRLVAGLVDGAYAYGRTLLRETGEGEGPVAERVDVRSFAPVRVGSKVTVPMSWEVGPGAVPFDGIELDLEIAPLGSAHSQLAVNARLRRAAPLRQPAPQAAASQRVSEAIVKHFLDNVRTTILEGTTPAG